MDFYNKFFFRIFIAKDNYVETNEFLAKFVLVSFISLLQNKKESFNPIQDGFWWGCSTMGRQKAPTHLPKIWPTYPTIMKIDTVTPYLKKIQKIYQSRKSSLDSCWHKHFFYQKSSTFVTSRNTDIDFISMLISNSFNFFWVFKCCFHTPNYNFDDVSKIGYSRPSYNKGILKQRLWRHNFY